MGMQIANGAGAFQHIQQGWVISVASRLLMLQLIDFNTIDIYMNIIEASKQL